MTRRNITYSQECDLKNVVVGAWPILAECYADILPAQCLESKNAIASLQREGILDTQIKIKPKWREAINEALKERAINQMTKDEVRLAVEAWVRLEYPASLR